MLDAIGYLCMHAWPSIGPRQDAKQLVPPTVPQRAMRISHKLCPGHKWFDIHPMLGQSGGGLEEDLQFMTIHPIHLPQLLNLVVLVHILE